MQIPQVRKNSFLVLLATSVAAAVGVLGVGRGLFKLMLLYRVGSSHVHDPQPRRPAIPLLLPPLLDYAVIFQLHL